ncbi:MAG TPA: nuclear transport factor 2 family protein [Pyrinomonadaceae bacterium]|jgi:hypothetical protein
MMRIIFVLLIVAVAAAAQSPAPDAAELTKLLNDFLAGASRNDPQVHDRFWAEDLIYTRSAGRRVSKAEVMRDVRSAPAPKPGDPKTTYTAEDVRIQQYGDTAIVAFKLVGTTDRNGAIEVSNFLNSGTFLKRDGKWQVVNWQATRMPIPPEVAKRDVTRAHDEFFKAILTADSKRLEQLTDESFIWMHRTGNQETRKQLLEHVTSGQLKYSKLETTNVVVSLTGDTAVVRGTSPRQRIPGPGVTSAETQPFTAFYTLVFVNQSGSWRAVAMHTSWVG